MAKVDLKTPVWDENGKLYRPGKGVEVPDSLAKKLGASKDGTSTDTGTGSASLSSVDFASEAAREAAQEAGLTAGDFEDATPSSANGFTKPDVQAIIDAEQ
jgi:hypothetical protein